MEVVLKLLLLVFLSFFLATGPILDNKASSQCPVSEITDSGPVEEYDEEPDVLLENRSPAFTFHFFSIKWKESIPCLSRERIGRIFRPPIFS